MNLKPILSLAAAHQKATLILVAVTLASGGYAAWLHEHDARICEQATMQQALAHADSAIQRATAVQRVADTLVVHDSIRVTRTTHALDTLWASLPDTIRTRADTVRALTYLPVIRQQSDSVTRACRDAADSCAAFKVAAYALEDSLRAKIDLQAKRARAAKPSRFSWGITGGLATVRDGTGWHTGPGLTLGLTLRF
jgi:hypothetical protein